MKHQHYITSISFRIISSIHLSINLHSNNPLRKANTNRIRVAIAWIEDAKANNSIIAQKLVELRPVNV